MQANQPYDAGTTADVIPCPDLSSSPVGSSKLDDCECGEGLTKEYEYNLDDSTRANFACYCDKGKYLNRTDTPYKCLKCVICEPRFYKKACEKESPGTCTPCQVCASASQKLAGCGLLSACVCRDKEELVRTQWCPVADESKSPLAISARQASGLGSFTFEEVFGSDAPDADFVCSRPCDGVEYDSIQCDGPFACNVKTCAEKNVAGEYPKACPVVMEAKDVPQLRQDKRREKCVSCKDCGHSDSRFVNGATWKNLHYEHWGGGCARECSKLLCADQQIWDWTQKKCSPCSELRDARLCSKRDWLALHLDTRSVTGNWALIQFPECQGEMAGKKLQSFEYGRCELCTANSECPLASKYPAMCVEGQVQCKACHRAGGGQARRVDVFKDWWYNANSSAFEPLHCQISACIDSSMTGVRVQDVCTRACSVVVCQANEIQVPCRLPHDARCEAVFPNLQTFEYAGDEVNLLNEATDRHGRFASFENVLIVLQDPEDAYQCVWNADGIFDVKTSPAGVSSVFWLAGRSNDEDFEERGTRLCRIWDVPADTVMPLLPLQNTVGDGNADASRIDALQARSRRMLVNTEAYVVSYEFGGAFVDTANIHGSFTNNGHQASAGMLQHAHVGGAGRLFLVLRMHESKAVVAVTVPSDRRLHEAMWVKTLLLSFAVVDVTQYCRTCEHAAISVSVTTTVDDKQISNLADNFVLESFWVQQMHTVALDDAADLGDDSRLFTLRVSDPLFKDWQRCNATDSQALAVVSMQVAPFKADHTQANYSWLGQHEGSAVPFQVTMQCLKGTRLLADIECTNARDTSVGRRVSLETLIETPLTSMTLVFRFCYVSSVRSTSDGRGPVTRKRVPDREEPGKPRKDARRGRCHPLE